ncbi:Histone H2A deubiquitinase [Actinidia chinensis var. chinensis]|uniref:Histone H2A deubiquitinase n=1 Tax=Actinidia chinensis var. chinensis TaxID=1590841 RepID=A0A2R6PBB1_ACTCC|nr:Histone H2A deubiquitinase [Actinidia chinensis var. chinensis]
MAAESNTGFRHEGTFGSALSRHAIYFQSGSVNSSSEMIPMVNFFGVNSTAGMMFSGNSSIVNNNTGTSQTANSFGSLLLDSVPGLKHETGFAVEWSVEEQYRLDEGLRKYASEPSIMRYIKIAALLRDKTVRDVALRCKWLTRKRRKQEEHNLGKKMKDRKDKMMESSSKTNISSASASPSDRSPYSLIMNHLDHIEHMPLEALSGTARNLLEKNSQVLSQISANLSTLKLRDNIELFFCTRNNIAAILNDMREMPGIMSHMPPLPVFMNEELANSIFTNASEAMMFGSSSGIRLKQEPGC